MTPQSFKNDTDYMLRYTASTPAGEVGQHETYGVDCKCKPEVSRDDTNGWTTITHKALADAEKVNVDIKTCQRCGETHDALTFAPLANPADEFTHWAICPKTHQPLSLKITQTEDVEA